jgi:hypothetical protein
MTTVPLLDHFHLPLSERRPWESFLTTWATAIADILNRDVLPPEYIALEQIQAGAAVEIDLGTYGELATASGDGGGAATATRTVWTPATAPLMLPGEFPARCTVEVVTTEGGRTLAAAIELVSPGNKDRALKRRLFAAKCATYLSRGIGLIVVDVVTSRRGNMHDEMADLLSLDAGLRMPGQPPLYAVAYRPLREGGQGRIETWPVPLEVGQPLPTLPLSLHAELCVPVNLEAAYGEACQRRRVADALARPG